MSDFSLQFNLPIATNLGNHYIEFWGGVRKKSYAVHV